MDIPFPSPFVGDPIHCPVYVFGPVVKYQTVAIMYTEVWLFYVVLLVKVFVFVYSHAVFYYYSSIIYLEIWNGNPSFIVHFAQGYLGYLCGSSWSLFYNIFLDCLIDWFLILQFLMVCLDFFFYNTYNSGTIAEEGAERLWEPKFQLTSHRPNMGWQCCRYLRFSWK